MIITIKHRGKKWEADLSSGIDISIPISSNGSCAWNLDRVSIEPVVNRHFKGSVKLGGGVNFRDIKFNPHGHGTHTESFGHISPEVESINDVLSSWFFFAELISVTPITVKSEKGVNKMRDRMVVREEIVSNLCGNVPEALIIRTLPNSSQKKKMDYSNTNFCYLEKEALKWMAEVGIQHLLVDLPSVDRENDGGQLEGHRAFWNYPENIRRNATITEMIYADDSVKDGSYLLNLQVASIENDASPSRPVLYSLQQTLEEDHS
ncbi:MAG: cyclase family protein [Crocinitomicaceae bacterium]|nr:cyclase family protein [Crocinitomicaceae bacterium]